MHPQLPGGNLVRPNQQLVQRGLVCAVELQAIVDEQPYVPPLRCQGHLLPGGLNLGQDLHSSSFL